MSFTYLLIWLLRYLPPEKKKLEATDAVLDEVSGVTGLDFNHWIMELSEIKTVVVHAQANEFSMDFEFFTNQDTDEVIKRSFRLRDPDQWLIW